MTRGLTTIIVVWIALGTGCHEAANVAPDPAEAGAQITISGSGFRADQGTSSVLYDGVLIAVDSWSATTIVATLPFPKPDGTYALEVVVHGETASLLHSIEPSPMGYQLGIEARHDGGGFEPIEWASLPDAPSAIEIDWSAGPGTGFLVLSINGQEEASIDNINNDTWAIDRVQWGAVSGIDPATAGSYYLDEFASFRGHALVFADGLESGDTSAWSGAAPRNVQLAVNSSAALGGNFGLEISIPLSSTASAFVVSTAPFAEAEYRATFWMDPNGIVIQPGSAHTIFESDTFRVHLGYAAP